MKHVKITGKASEMCWWRDCIGHIAPVLDVYEPTGFVKIRLTIPTQPWEGCYDPRIQVEGYIPPEYVVVL